jgi:diketogulonate reductase-like aldo/keto reductase
MIFNETYTLSNGVNIPKLGLGTWFIDVLELGAVALPKTANPSHMKDNALLDFSISEEDMERLKAFTPIKD